MTTEEGARIIEQEKEIEELKEKLDYYQDRCGKLEMAVGKIIKIVTGIAPY